MAEVAELSVTVIAQTEFLSPEVPWDTDADGGQALAEFAGRACYQSWSRPNPATATNKGYLAHILDVGHMSVLEHGVVTLYLTGVSRSLTHELVRHRHFSYSQLSQRYVDSSNARMLIPDEAVGDAEALALLHESFDDALVRYEKLVSIFDAKLADTVTSKTDRRKRARQAARSILPNCTETQIVVTGNFRAWRHFINLRANVAADREIRTLAMAVFKALYQVAPNVFSDCEVVVAHDGLEAVVMNAPMG